MELVAPIAAVSSALRMRAWSTLGWGSRLMLLLFVVHYANRAVIQPLRNPPRSPMKLSVMLSAILFNSANGFLIGTWAASAQGKQPPRPGLALPLGLLVFCVGLGGNIWHDEVLISLRREKQPRKGDVRGLTTSYSIPHGGLYRFVSYPNYLCECKVLLHSCANVRG